MANEGAPAGGRKYLLVQPDTFELLVKNFEDVQRVKQNPAIKLAIQIEKKVTQLKESVIQGETSRGDAQLSMKALLLELTDNICLVFNTGEFCEVKKEAGSAPASTQKVEAKLPTFFEPLVEDDVTEVVKKKRKWVSFEK